MRRDVRREEKEKTNNNKQQQTKKKKELTSASTDARTADVIVCLVISIRTRGAVGEKRGNTRALDTFASRVADTGRLADDTCTKIGTHTVAQTVTMIVDRVRIVIGAGHACGGGQRGSADALLATRGREEAGVRQRTNDTAA